MPDYRAHLAGSDGHFFKSVALDQPDDTAAIAAATQLIDGHDVELWQRPQDRRIFEERKIALNPTASYAGSTRVSIIFGRLFRKGWIAGSSPAMTREID